MDDNSKINHSNPFKSLKPIDLSKLEPHVPQETPTSITSQEIPKKAPAAIQTNTANNPEYIERQPSKRFKPLIIGAAIALACVFLFVFLDELMEKLGKCSTGIGCAFGGLAILLRLSPFFVYGCSLFLLGIINAIINSPKRKRDYKNIHPYLWAFLPILFSLLLLLFFIIITGYDGLQAIKDFFFRPVFLK